MKGEKWQIDRLVSAKMEKLDKLSLVNFLLQ